MKEVLQNPIVVQLELSLVEDIIRVIGSAIHNQFSHDAVTQLKQRVVSRAQEAITAQQQVNSEAAQEDVTAQQQVNA